MGKEQKKRFYGEMRANAVREGGTCKNPVRFSMQDGPMETVEYMWVNNWCMLIAPSKIRVCKGSISPSNFYGQLPGYQSFYSPIYLVDEGNEDVGLVSETTSYCFFVWCESSSLLWL